MRRNNSWLAGLLALLATGTGAQAAEKPVSGEFRYVLIGVDPQTQMITGWFESPTEDATQHVCAFLIVGKLGKEESEVLLFHPSTPQNTVKGKIGFESQDGKLALALTLDSPPTGCALAPALTSHGTSLFALIRKGDFKQVRVVSAKKAFFHKKPQAGSKGKASVVQFSRLRVFEEKEHFVRASFTPAKGKALQGWIPMGDLFGLNP